jgi:hypothetical protein
MPAATSSDGAADQERSRTIPITMMAVTKPPPSASKRNRQRRLAPVGSAPRPRRRRRLPGIVVLAHLLIVQTCAAGRTFDLIGALGEGLQCAL